MSAQRQQALIDAPVEVVWQLVGDPARHPEWWPRVIEVKGQRFEEGTTYVQTTKSPGGTQTTSMMIERLDEAREVRMRCQETGTYAYWLLTEARGSTFVDVELGMEPRGLSNRVFDAAIGKRYFRRWLEQSVDALREAAKTAAAA
jgi:uncharacterized protein YndB with AHSA1/START domain